MRSMTLLRLATVFLALALPTVVAPARIDVIAHAHHIARVQQDYARLPLNFEANQGQTEGQVKFLSRGSGYTLFLTSTEAVLTLYKSERKPKSTTGTVVRMKLIGANPASRVTGLQTLPGTVNYFIGNDRSKWRTNVSTYARVRYEHIYPGVDLVYYGTQRQLEYDFVVAPGADSGVIKLAFAGASGFEIDDEGDLVLSTVAGDLRMHRPRVYQEVGGVKQRIPSRYVLENTHQVGFDVASYDRSKPLVIDPVLAYSTYLGGSLNDSGFGIAVDSAGNAYVTGSTASLDFPTTPEAFDATSGGDDAFVTKINPSGTALVYSTYLGGSRTDQSRSGADHGFGIAVDASGSAYVTGETASSNFPTTPGAFDDALNLDNCFRAICPADVFVARLNATGSALDYSTYLGGSGSDAGRGISVDAFGSAYVAGSTGSPNFPTTPGAVGVTTNGANDAFVTKLNTTGTDLDYSTYLGGSNEDSGNGIALDATGNAYVTGVTRSINFPTTPGAFDVTRNAGNDAFVTKLHAGGTTLDYSTYLGGSANEAGQGIALDASGSAYVTGRTTSPDFPTTPGAFDQTSNGNGDAFVTKIDVTGAALEYSTYLGGSASSPSETGVGIAVDASGNAYVTGVTDSTDFPTTPGAVAEVFNGGFVDAFVTKINVAGTALDYSSYFGGSGSEGIGGIAADSFGNAYVTGATDSTNFPTSAGAFDEAFNGGLADAFVAKIPTATIEGLIAQIATLDLTAGEQTGLVSKLQAAERSLARGNIRPAINQLNAFINQVRALERSGRLDGDRAEAVIAQTQAIINGL